MDQLPNAEWLKAPDWFWPRFRVVLQIVLWGLCAYIARGRIDHALHEFDTVPNSTNGQTRVDGSTGHVMIDFAGQWLMGRMLVTGHGRELYHRQQQWPTLWRAFPIANESSYMQEKLFPSWRSKPSKNPLDGLHDSEKLMLWFMGTDATTWSDVGPPVTLPLAANPFVSNPFSQAVLLDISQNTLKPETIAEINRPAIGGPLYPPIHAFLYAPLALDDHPLWAYHAIQWLTMTLTFFAGYGISLIARGRIWWSVATLAILAYPGYRSGLDLAQNQVFTLTILVWGWVCYTRGRGGLAGVVWGLLAFKPVWAMTFLMVPLLLRQWRFLFAMMATGASMALLTIPFVGLQSWWDWLAVGKEASKLYDVNANWIMLSRDLSGIPRRVMIDFTLPENQRASQAASVASWGLMLIVVGTTICTALFAANRRQHIGVSAGFVLLGAYLCCYRFMYYDAVISVLPIAVLLANPRALAGSSFTMSTKNPDGRIRWWHGSLNSFVMTVVCGLYLLENVLMQMAIEGTLTLGMLGTPSTQIGGMPDHAPKITVNTTVYYPVDTVLLLLIWAWCAIQLWLGQDFAEAPATPRSVSKAAPMSGERISDSPTKTA